MRIPLILFRKHLENIVPFSEIIFVLLQAYSHYIIIMYI